MRNYITIIFTLLVLFFSPSKAEAQIDTAFWFAAPWVTPDHASNIPIALRISTFNAPTTVRVYQPAGTYDSTFVVPANSLNSHFLTPIVNTLESKPADNVLNYGIKIEADTLITVVYEAVTNVNNPETYSLKGTNGLGMEFITPFQTTWRNGVYSPIQPKSMICIVATEDNTTVWITPKAAVVGHPANITYSIVLNKGQVYTVENLSQLTNTPGNNLSGSIVVSNKPIAVTVSDDSVWNAAGGGCRDLMGDQLVPVDVIGTEYIVNKGNMNAASTEGMYIVATENFTTVTVINASGTTVQLLNRGDTWSYIIVDPLSYVQSDKPIYLLQASGFGCELGEAILPPINCAGSAQVSFNRSNIQTFILNVLCPTTAINDFLMDGNPAMVPGSAFNPVPGTGGFWSGAQITYTTAQIPAGSSPFLENTSDFFALGVINGGSNSGCFYHYMSSFIRRVYTKAGNDTTLCNGVATIDLNGSVTGATNTGIWSVLNGTGNFANSTDLITTYSPTQNDYNLGSLTFLLSSTGNCIAVTDTVVVDFIQAPVVNAGPDDSYCKNNVGAVPINGNVQYASTGLWSGGNGGAFGNSSSLTTTYTPSPAELAADSVVLFLTSAGSFFSCPSDEDTLVIYFTPAPLVVAGGDQVLCSNATEAGLNGAISGATTTGIWSTSGSGAFSPSETNLITDYLISVSDTTAGSIYLTLTSTNNQNCLVESDSIQITIIPQPELTITSQDSVCSNSVTLDLTGTIVNGFGAEWTTSGFGTIANPNNLNTIYTVSPIDVLNGFIDVFFNTTGVCAIEGDSMRIHFIAPPIANAGIDQAYCENTPIQLNGTVTGPNPAGLWSSMGTGSFNPGNAFLQTLYFPSAADVANGGVSLILAPNNTFGCVSQNDTVFIVFKEIPQADYTVSPVCQGENAIFLDQSTTSTGTITDWMWNFDDSQTSITQNPLHQFVTSGTFDVSLIVTGSNDCVDTAIYSLVINPLPNPMFTNTNACENGIIFFTDVSTISSGTNTGWLYDFFSFGSSTDQMPQFSFNAPGTYPVSFTVTSNFGCEASIVQDVVVLPSPVANFSMNPNPALALQDVVFTDQSTGNQVNDWLWNFGDGEVNNNQNAIHDYDTGGTYTVVLTVSDINNCSDTVSQVISIALLPVLPTGFTPNGDGENDIFLIRGGPFKTVDFKVYNNWGELIFSTNDGNVGWDGTFKGENSPFGVYTWTFIVEMGNGQVIKKTGDVTLIR
jgi:gliding motility-associated-like protein